MLNTFKSSTTLQIYNELPKANLGRGADLQNSLSLYEDYKQEIHDLKECAAEISVFCQWWDWLRIEGHHNSHLYVGYEVSSLWEKGTIKRWNDVRFSFSTFARTVG